MTEVEQPEVKCKKLHEIRVPDKRLGRHIEHDPRSRAYGIVSFEMTVLKPVLHFLHGGILNQGDLGSCTGNACAGAINSDPVHKPHKKTLKEPDALALYAMASVLDEFAGSYPPDDTGSSGLAVAKAAKQRGYISAYHHAFGINDALKALQLLPVITGVEWYEGFDEPDLSGMVYPTGEVRGGHEFLVVGYDPASDRVAAVNSWGREWGHKGRFYFTSKVWGQLLENEGDVTVLIR